MVDELQDLIASPGWAILARWLQQRKARHQTLLEQESSTADLAAVRGLQARIAELDAVLGWPAEEIRRKQATLARASESAQGAR